LQSYNQKIIVNLSPNISSQKQKFSFGSGWNPRISEAIKNCDVEQITEEMTRMDIETDFADNKVVAWCSNQVVKIFEHLNDRFSLKFDLPKGIFVEDFSKLNIKPNEMRMHGFCNWLPAYVLKESDKVFHERTLFFNSFHGQRNIYKWENINPDTEKLFKDKKLGSGHFLTVFLHEFFHSSHNGHLLKKFNQDNLHERLKSLTNPAFIIEFHRRYGKLLSDIGKQAIRNPLEVVANDMCMRIASSLDSKILLPTHNPFKLSPYQNNSLLARLNGLRTKEKVLRKIWNGYDML